MTKGEAMPAREGFAAFYFDAADRLGRFPKAIVLLALRIGIGMVFWKSGLTKVTTNEAGTWPLLPLELGTGTVDLFATEYKLPFLPPEPAAWLASLGELALPWLLFLGFGARFGAAGLLGMTLVIQVFVYPTNWAEHLLWAGALIAVLTRGAGAISVDQFIANRYR